MYEVVKLEIYYSKLEIFGKISIFQKWTQSAVSFKLFCVPLAALYAENELIVVQLLKTVINAYAETVLQMMWIIKIIL